MSSRPPFPAEEGDAMAFSLRKEHSRLMRLIKPSRPSRLRGRGIEVPFVPPRLALQPRCPSPHGRRTTNALRRPIQSQCDAHGYHLTCCMSYGWEFTCTACGAKSKFGEREYSYRSHSGEMIDLPSPKPLRNLKRLGTSHNRALKKLQLYERKDLGCRTCGIVGTHRDRLIPSGVVPGPVYIALLASTFVAPLLFIVFAKWRGIHGLWNAAGVALCFFAPWILFKKVMELDPKLAKRHYREHHNAVQVPRCTACGGSDLAAPWAFGPNTEPPRCPMCRARALVRGDQWFLPE